jgi:insulysin
LNEKLRLPTKNEFIPKDVELKAGEECEEAEPVIVLDTPLCRVWFLHDTEFLLPKAAAYVELCRCGIYL